jgi:hypothetical protein
MEATCNFEKSFSFYQTIWRYIRESKENLICSIDLLCQLDVLIENYFFSDRAVARPWFEDGDSKNTQIAVAYFTSPHATH